MPELSFTTGTFGSVYEALIYAQLCGKGTYFDWMARTAKRLKCLVFAGYPEKDPCHDKVYNSMMVVSENGELLKNYRKHQLFYSESVWATPGSHFDYVDAIMWRLKK